MVFGTCQYAERVLTDDFCQTKQSIFWKVGRKNYVTDMHAIVAIA